MSRNIDWRSLPIVGIAVLTGLILVGGPAEARDPIEVTLACPTTILSTGGSLNITLTAKNRTSSPKAIAAGALAVHIGNLNLLGPFVIPLTLNLGPSATAVVPFFSSPVPAGTAPPGILVTVGVFVMDSANQPIGSNYCLVRIQ